MLSAYIRAQRFCRALHSRFIASVRTGWAPSTMAEVYPFTDPRSGALKKKRH